MSQKRTIQVLLASLAVIGCGGNGTDPGDGDVIMAKASPSGDGQSAPLGTVLANPLRVVLTSTQGGGPVAGRSVTWLGQAGVQLNPVTATSGSDGVASTVVTLPLFGSNRTITATVVGAVGSPQVFSVTATGAGDQVNVQVVNNEFLPSTFSIRAGGIVTFTWATGAGSHNVTPVAPNTIPTSTNPAPPGTHSAPHTFDATFPAAGTFKFYCGVHGGVDTGMHGTITVVP